MQNGVLRYASWLVGIAVFIIFILAGESLFNQVGSTKPYQSTSATGNLALGNPSGANREDPDNFLIERDAYSVSFNRSKGTANWVSWSIESSDLGHADRSDSFLEDPELPSTWRQANMGDYIGTGYDRGHLCPSADRTENATINQETFYFSNIIPQAPQNNRGVWADLEEYTRLYVKYGRVVYVIAGGDGSIGKLSRRIVVPAYTWKIVLVMPEGSAEVGNRPNDVEVIAVRVPNKKDALLQQWTNYRVSVAEIEEVTGYTFFSNLPPNVRAELRERGAES